MSIFFEYSRIYSTFPVHRRCHWHLWSKRFYYSWMILSNELTLLRINIYWWLVFFTDCSFKCIGKLSRSYWCINGVNDMGNACIAGVIDTGEVGNIYRLVSITPVMHDITGVNDTGDMLRRCHWHRQIHASPVSLTPANACFAGVNDTGGKFFAGVVDTGEAL